MALAIARWKGEDDGYQEFDIDIGANRFYAWAVGASSRRTNGIPMLTSRSRSSELIGPIQPGQRGRALLRVPSDAFDADHHHLQLLSFRDEQLRGPAASDIIEVPWRWTPPGARAGADGRTGPLPMAASMAYAPPMSHAQFLETIAEAVSKLLPFVREAVPAITPILNSLAGGSPSGTPAAGAPAPDLAQLLAALLRQLQTALGPATTARATALSEQARAQGGAHRYSYASWAQLLAALPALSGVLQNVLTPETMQALIQAADPTKMANVLINGLMTAARIGQEATDKLHQHLRELNPGLGDDVLVPLLASLSQSASGHDGRRPYTLSQRVRLGVADLAPVELNGYPQVAFRHGEPITVPVTVDTPRPIPQATLELCVKDASTYIRLAERRWSYPRVQPGRLPEPVILPAALTHRLRPGGEYVVDLTLSWSGRRGLVGTSISQLVRIVGERTFDSLDSGGPPIRLDDISLDRPWWHQVWTVDFDATARRVDAELAYTYRFAPDLRDGTRRLNTQADVTRGAPGRAAGRITAGLDVSAAALSQLARRLGEETFDDDTIAALADERFARAFQRIAHCRVSLHARRGGRAAVWVWPEVKLHKAVFRTPDQISPLTGQILSFTPVPVVVPLPALAHVISARTP